VLWRIRAFDAAADRECVDALWRAAMPPSWPLLPAGVASLGEGLVAEADAGPVGFAAVDLAGSVPLILVDPHWQRQGIGARLLGAAVGQVRAGGAVTTPST